MKQKTILLALMLSLLLTGCSLLDGSYVHVTPHREQSSELPSEAVSASDYAQLCKILENMIAAGTENGVINVTEYDQDIVEKSMAVAVRHVMEVYPIGAYAVHQIDYEVGTNSGRPAIAVTVHYLHGSMELQKIQKVRTMEEAKSVIAEALKDYSADVVLQIEEYKDVDFTQLVQDYAELYPEFVMETPQVTAGIYGSSSARVVELTFAYQTSRDSLRSMQAQVKPVFEAAALYVSGDGADYQKYAQLYAFLMERFDYKLETSITPTYSLLRHGVGDSRAFAQVYASMCRMAGLECLTVTGTHAGEPWTWNIIKDNDHYFHVDLQRCVQLGGFREFTDLEMEDYVWDYSAYPDCPAVQSSQPEEKTSVPGIETENTEPEETGESAEFADPTENLE